MTETDGGCIRKPPSVVARGFNTMETKTAQGEIRNRHYLTVISPGRLIIVRVPYPMPTPWRSRVVAPLTPLMTEQGLRAKDIYRIEGTIAYPDDPSWESDDQETSEKLDQAFDQNAPFFLRFWLYDWTENGYVLVRAGA